LHARYIIAALYHSTVVGTEVEQMKPVFQMSAN
jgi:hypothetical protein